MAAVNDAAERELGALLGSDAVLGGDAPGYSSDETEGRNLSGRPDAVVLPRSTDDVARVVRWCCEHDVPLVPRGGGTGFAGGAVPVHGGVVVALDRMTSVRSFDPALWRMHVEAGLRTAHVRRLARENGLFFPPDPGAAEQSQIGGNVATNAGGPHAFKYGVTGAWVTGIEAVVPPGEVIAVGGPIRKDVAGYDLRSLLIGSEGTLGVITAVWLRLIPAPEAALPLIAFYPGAAAGAQAVRRVMESGLLVAALEFLDGGTLTAAGASYPGGVPPGAAFAVIAEADGDAGAAERLRAEAAEVLTPAALRVDAPAPGSESAALWRWRDGISIAVTARRGGKASEDIVVPVDRLEDAIAETAGDRCAARPRGVQLGARRRRQPPLDVPARARRRGPAGAVRAGGSGAVRSGCPPGRIDQRRARRRLGQTRPAGAPVGRSRARPARGRQAGVRPGRRDESRQEDRPPLTADTH